MCILCRVVAINKLICVMVKIYLSCHVCYTMCSMSAHKRKLYILLICGSFVATSDRARLFTTIVLIVAQLIMSLLLLLHFI